MGNAENETQNRNRNTFNVNILKCTRVCVCVCEYWCVCARFECAWSQGVSGRFRFYCIIDGVTLFAKYLMRCWDFSCRLSQHTQAHARTHTHAHSHTQGYRHMHVYVNT